MGRCPHLKNCSPTSCIVKHGALCARRRRWLRRAAQLSCCAPSDFAASAGRRSLAVGACRGFRQTPTAKQMARSASRPIKNLIMISHRGWRSRHCILHDPQNVRTLHQPADVARNCRAIPVGRASIGHVGSTSTISASGRNEMASQSIGVPET
jgi:hypothetical protein